MESFRKKKTLKRLLLKSGWHSLFRSWTTPEKKREYVAGYAMGRPFIRQKFDMDAVTRRQLEDILEKLKVQAKKQRKERLGAEA